MITRSGKSPFIVSALAAAIMVSGCGGGGTDTAGIGGSGYISSGSVTGFGSVFVNGVEFETTSGTIFDVEDNIDATQALLRVGMVVQVEGTINADGVTGTATGIQYSDDIEGPISSLSGTVADPERTLIVLGKMIVISATDTVYESVTYADVAQGNVIEVSGFEDQNGTLHASYVELKSTTSDASSIFEIKGVIGNLSGTGFTLQGVTVDASGANLSDLPTGLQDGLLVEVKGTYDGTTITATEVDAESNELSEDAAEVELEGLIANYIPDDEFYINGIRVDISNAIFTPMSPSLKNGDKVEVEGTMLNGDFIAMEVEVRGGNAEVSAPVGDTVDTTNNNFNMILAGQSITVQLTAATRIEDDNGIADDYISLINSVQESNFVDVKGFESGSNTITATRVKRESEVKEVELQGVVATPVSTSVTVLGVTFLVDGDTKYEDASDVSINHATFISTVNSSSETVVSIKDKLFPDGNPQGTADEVEIED